ncbi:MAG: AAA family ATPase [Sulfolobales archaeon]|nr:AAA family ATPase [Sulfolobales archaeon]MCX8199380.1 AAA family ATPase [Sulfolobales archaeon]MDW8170306.1 AAA family ATPase [Desulfurococcaceae archaeon]
MKIAIVGKGGVGKTTIAACLARLLSRDGYSVIAVDADPSLNLAQALGIPRDVANSVPVLFDYEEFIKSRTLRPSGVYLVNPRVNDVVERFTIKGPDGVKLLKLGAVRKGGARCLCPEYAFLRALLSHLILGRKDIVILDMVAGLEHMSRGAARGVDLMLCITEPSVKAIDVALQMHKLSKDLDVKMFAVVINKASSEDDVGIVKRALEGVEVIGVIPYDASVIEADREGISLIDYAPTSKAIQCIKELKKYIEAFIK